MVKILLLFFRAVFDFVSTREEVYSYGDNYAKSRVRRKKLIIDVLRHRIMPWQSARATKKQQASVSIKALFRHCFAI